MSKIQKVLVWIVGTMAYAVGGMAFAECSHEPIYNYYFQLSMDSAVYNRDTDSITFNLRATRTSRQANGSTCSGSGGTPLIKTQINVDGRVVTYDKYSTSGFTYSVNVPGKTANTVVLSGTNYRAPGGNASIITGSTYNAPFVSGMNAAPTVSNRTLSTTEDTSKSLTLSASDPDAGDSHYYQIVSGSSNGTELISGSTFTFTPNANWSGTTTVTYRAVDSSGDASNNGIITITVTPVNDAPTAVASTLNTNEDVTGSITLGVVDPDIPYGDTHIFEIVSQPSIGNASISGKTLTYAPPSNWSGSTNLTYRVRDSEGVWSPAVTVSINVAAVNDAPVSAPKTLTLQEDSTGNVTLTATDVDSPPPVVFQIVSTPAQGSAWLSGSEMTYTPPANWSGTTTLTYRAQDSSGAWSAPVSVNITVSPVNDVPELMTPISITTQEGKQTTIDTRIWR